MRVKFLSSFHSLFFIVELFQNPGNPFSQEDPTAPAVCHILCPILELKKRGSTSEN